jgi:hypothetical protein
VEGLGAIWETSVFAGFVSENLLMKEESRELKNHLGKSFKIGYCLEKT